MLTSYASRSLSPTLTLADLSYAHASVYRYSGHVFYAKLCFEMFSQNQNTSLIRNWKLQFEQIPISSQNLFVPEDIFFSHCGCRQLILIKGVFVFSALEAGVTGVGAQQLSVCTLQAGSVCSVDTGEVRRVSALSSVPLPWLCTCMYVCVCLIEGRRVGQRA